MSLRACKVHGPYIADTSTDFGETWCPECGPLIHQPKEDRRMTKATIWKYKLIIGRQDITMPEGAGLLHVGMQGGDLHVWALVDPEAPQVPHRIYVHATGLPIEHSYEYVGTVLDDADEVWHVFDGGDVLGPRLDDHPELREEFHKELGL